jgi:hypothetical protein
MKLTDGVVVAHMPVVFVLVALQDALRGLLARCLYAKQESTFA